jgi:putative FmdB family regulatory protein
MPTYAYRCTACAHEFEAVQKMSDDAFRFCPECGAPIKRVIFPAGIVFKGSGFYINDSRSSKSDSSNDTSQDKSSTSTAASETSAPKAGDDAKPASTPAAPAKAAD